ncbi:Calcineurin-like phosphoesterase [Gemmata sp. SH-PL17]|uniref:purple acid phosphatase family protein n=1 Tax=Gemmata sp. SH-PL17 TaxID=1630693 RepID=UPI00078BDF7C|nr:metallophosphoesterase family protein [Gemmata sp. SH-PL17]AMV26926.1 Calcineurin-like phosphoesterase [Gemmata sp. SH-PL17]
MTPFSRRTFLRSSAGGLASALVAGHSSHSAENVDVAPPPRRVGGPVPMTLVPQDTLFLTWQRDPTTTITVQWVGPETPEPTPLRIVPRDGDLWKTGTAEQKPFGPTDLKVHRCEFTGLQPGTEYMLQVGKNALAYQIGWRTESYRFRTMPAKATDTFQWVSGGDCGTGPHAIGTNIVAAKQEPYFAFIGGDLGYDNGTSAKTAIQFLQNYAKHMVDPKGRLIPMVTCLGNHEVRGGYKGKRSDATYYFPLFDGLYKDTTYGTLDFGDYLSLVLLDSGHVSPIGGEQSDWLATALAEREGRPHLIVANHVPAYPSFRDPATAKTGALGTGEANRIHWCPLFEKYGVDAVLEHHDHTFKRTHPLKDGLRDKYGVPYLGDGSWGQLRKPGTPEKRPYLASVGHAYHMTVHRLEGEQRYHVALEESGRVADVYGTFGKRPAKRG